MDRERGSALVIVMLVLLVLLGLGLMALRQTRTEMATTGNVRAARQAWDAAHMGLVRSSITALTAPDHFHRLAVLAILDDAVEHPTYTFGADQVIEAGEVPGIFRFAPALTTEEDEATFDVDRAGNLDFRSTMSRPRLASPPPGFQVAGGSGSRFVFYVYEFDVTGWVGRRPGEELIEPGTGGARRRLRADVRLGPIAVNQ
jgi:hypothetical protein